MELFDKDGNRIYIYSFYSYEENIVFYSKNKVDKKILENFLSDVRNAYERYYKHENDLIKAYEDLYIEKYELDKALAEHEKTFPRHWQESIEEKFGLLPIKYDDDFCIHGV